MAAAPRSMRLSGTETRVKDALTASPVIGADETGLRVSGQSHRMRVAGTDRLTHYASAPRPGKEAMGSIGLLPAHAGTAVSDALCACRQYRESRHALCGADLLRGLTYIKETCLELALAGWPVALTL